MAFALALTTTSPVSSIAVATAPAPSAPLASSLLIAPTSSISLTPQTPGDPVASDDAPADDSANLSTSTLQGAGLDGSKNNTFSDSDGAAGIRGSGSGSNGSTRVLNANPSAAAGGQSAAGQSTAGHLPDLAPESKHCFAAAGMSSITRACCASIKGSFEQSGGYCLFRQDDSKRKTWESCVGTATGDNTGRAFAMKCSSARRSKAAWAVIGLGVAIACGFS